MLWLFFALLPLSVLWQLCVLSCCSSSPALASRTPDSRQKPDGGNRLLTKPLQILKKGILATIAAILIICQISCMTGQAVRAAPPVPDPIDDSGASVIEYDETTDTVSMPFWYWCSLWEYINFTHGMEE